MRELEIVKDCVIEALMKLGHESKTQLSRMAACFSLN